MTRLFPASNELLTVGNALLFSTMGAPPPRGDTNISMAICLNWGRICFSATWNRAVFSGQDCYDFLELYKKGWEEWVKAGEMRANIESEPQTVSQDLIGPL
ncbi:MAG: hypothetical protein SFV81_25835, partial [Pirellulaceae bacterium]|nr:hypothetical protein [Pirellulaceae bacterium]